MNIRKGRISFALLFVAGVLHANAQFPKHQLIRLKVKSGYVREPYQPSAQLKARELVAMTKPGYYSGRFASGKWQTARKMVTLQQSCDANYFCSLAALPVTLVLFKGSRTDADNVQLFWETSLEKNNLRFEVERSFTGSTDFATIGSVKGSGNSAETKRYTLTDRNNSTSISYYRLKQVDFDGAITYSRIISVEGIKEGLALTAIPNPGTSLETRLQVKGLEAGTEIGIIIFDVKGIVFYLNEHFKLNAAQQIDLSKIGSLPAGFYQARVIAQETTLTVGFVIKD